MRPTKRRWVRFRGGAGGCCGSMGGLLGRMVRVWSLAGCAACVLGGKFKDLVLHLILAALGGAAFGNDDDVAMLGKVVLVLAKAFAHIALDAVAPNGIGHLFGHGDANALLAGLAGNHHEKIPAVHFVAFLPTAQKVPAPQKAIGTPKGPVAFNSMHWVASALGRREGRHRLAERRQAG